MLTQGRLFTGLGRSLHRGMPIPVLPVPHPHSPSWLHPTCIHAPRESLLPSSILLTPQHPMARGAPGHPITHPHPGAWPGCCIPLPSPDPRGIGQPAEEAPAPRVLPAPQGALAPRMLLAAQRDALAPQGCSQPPDDPGPGRVVPHVLSRRRGVGAVAARGPPLAVPASRHRSGIG